MIELKRVYDSATRGDGARFLVERLWPRGIKKDSLRLDAWLRIQGAALFGSAQQGEQPPGLGQRLPSAVFYLFQGGRAGLA